MTDKPKVISDEDMEKFIKELEDFMDKSPMKTVIITEDMWMNSNKFETFNTDMEKNGYRMAAVSNAGLPKGKVRITYLESSCFSDTPSDFRAEENKKTPIDVRELVKKMDENPGVSVDVLVEELRVPDPETKDCTKYEGCTHHNLFCAYPDCTFGKAEKQRKRDLPEFDD